MDASKHVREGMRLDQALNGELDKISSSIKEVLIQNNLHSMPGIAFDTFCYVLEELHLEKLNLPVRS